MTEHFTLAELLRSATAERYPRLREQQKNPPPEVLENLQYLAETTLEPVRAIFGAPIDTTSGYRCPSINKKVGGSKTSQHVLGQAADIGINDRHIGVLRAKMFHMGHKFRDGANADFHLFAAICLNLARLDVDQVIHEYGDKAGRPAWVHVSASRDRNRRQILAVGKYTGRKYQNLTVDQALAMGQ